MAATSAAQEEAAYIASEFIYSIDNLPSEVAHLLQEIQHRETRCQELQREIDKDSNRYIRHSLRLSPSSSSSNSSSSGSPFSKLGVIPGKISAAYSEIQGLSNEKQELAQRLVSLIEQTRTRLDVELSKVRALQGEPLDFPGMPKPLVGVYSGLDATKMPALAMTESLMAALAGTPITDPRYSSPQPATPVATTPNVPSHKRRKATASASTPSIKVPAGAWGQKRSASPTVQSAVSTTGNQRSRLSRQIHPPTPDAEDDMEPEGDVEEEGDDDRAYCYCQKKSFGEMIACDNDDCPYEWFHYSCVGIKAGAPLPQNFFCDDCKAKLQKAEKEPALTRKGRRK